MPDVSTDACEREIRELHAFFVDWYAGRVDREAFEWFERALAPEFAMIGPGGERRDREAVLAMVREGYGAREGFDIEIRAVEPVATGGDLAVVRYEEWQSGGDGETGRISTACFRAGDVPEDVVWAGLQETWLDGGD